MASEMEKIKRLAEQHKEVQMSEFRSDLRDIINKHSKENGSNTPDFILANMLAGFLETFDEAMKAREDWSND